jgi:hypothetical protein
VPEKRYGELAIEVKKESIEETKIKIAKSDRRRSRRSRRRK